MIGLVVGKSLTTSYWLYRRRRKHWRAARYSYCASNGLPRVVVDRNLHCLTRGFGGGRGKITVGRYRRHHHIVESNIRCYYTRVRFWKSGLQKVKNEIKNGLQSAFHLLNTMLECPPPPLPRWGEWFVQAMFK